QKYFLNLTTTCILWPKDFDLTLKTHANNSAVILQIDVGNLNKSFDKDIYNFSIREQKDNSNGLFYNELVKKLVGALEDSHCEGFVAFQDDIPRFAEAFRLASVYSIWRSTYSRFLFAYTKDQQNEDYFEDLLFKKQPSILIIEAKTLNSSNFILKTNKFVGLKSQHPEELIFLSTFNALTLTFEPDLDLFSLHKLQNLQGREIVMGVFDYRPFVAIDFERSPQYYDYAADNPSHLVHVDGTEVRICHEFCDWYNCTVQFDTSEKGEWGTSYANYSGYGLIGMIMDDHIHMAVGAMYTDYIAVDLSTFIGRSGVTCLVPAPTRLTSWYLPLKPFHLTLWFGVFGCLLLETLALLTARRFELTVIDNEASNWWSCIQFGYITSLKLFISQGSDYIVNSHTVRTVLFACYMIDIIITSIYGGGLAATLTVPTLGEAPDSVERMYAQGLPWTATSSMWVASIRNDNNTVYHSLYNNFVVYSMEEMRAKAQTEYMGFILERLTFGHFGNGDFITPESLQRLKLMVDDIYNNFAVAMVSRLWAHLPKYNDFILAWHSAGLDKFWEWKIAAEYMNIQEQNQIQASMYTNMDMGAIKLDMKNFAGLAIIWIVGMVLSIMVFIAEILWHKFGCRLKF
ncbi:hypothetical protein FF38_01653, partial [Lucilia cuprina]